MGKLESLLVVQLKEGATAELHEIAKALAKKDAALARSYLVEGAKAGALGKDQISTVLEWLYKQRSIDVMFDLARELDNAEVDDPRLQEIVGFLQVLEPTRAEVEKLRTAYRLESDHLLTLRRMLRPDQNVQRADIFISILRLLVRRFKPNPNWKTPTSMEVEALCEAGRFGEARVAAKYEHDLRIKHEDALTYVTRREAAGAERQRPEIEHDYQRLLEMILH